MRTTWLAAALLLAACGNDPSPETKRPRRSLRPGETLEDTIRTKDSYDVHLAEFTWSEDVDDLPRGMDYDTLAVEKVRDDRLEIHYELSVGQNVEPGRYAFRVKYEFTGADYWEEVVRLKFVIHVQRGRSRASALTLRLLETPEEGDEEAVRRITVRLP